MKNKDSFLFRNLPAIKYKDSIILYDYFQSKIARVPLKDFKKENLPDLRYFGVPKQKIFNPKKSVLTLILNRECNMRCIYCFAEGGGKEILSKKCISAALRKVIKPETEEVLITFFGGEPTLCYDEIVFTVNEANKYPVKKQFAISTNGAMSKKMFDFLIKNNFAFNFSMDGLPEVQNKQRPLLNGAPSSEIVENTLKELIKNKMSFKVRVTITKDSVKKMPEMVKYLAKFGVKYIHLEVVNVSGRAEKLKIKKPPVNEFIKQFKECSELAKKLNVSLVNGVYTNLIEPSIHSCSAVTGGKLIITPEGNVSRCYEVQDKKHPYSDMFIVGKYNPFIDDFEFDNEKVKTLCNRNSETNKICENCFAKYICSGGCVIRNLHGLHSKDIGEIDPYQCKLIKALLKDAILRIYENSIIKNNGRIRLLKNNDWVTVKPWLYELAKESFGKVVPSILNKKIREDYQKEPEGFIVSEDGSSKKLNGLLWFSTFPEKKSVFIHAIYVNPTYRGKGVSDSLMDYLEEYCKKKDLENIELNVTVGLDYALRFYQRRGFEIKRYFMGKKVK